MKRRDFLQTGAFGSLGLFNATLGSSPRFTTNPFTLGVASGDPTSTSVIIWTRLAPEPLAGGGMPHIPVPVRWRVAHDMQMRRVVAQGLTIAWPSVAHAIHVDVDGLSPDRVYFYQFSVGSADSAVGRTRTLPRRDRQARSFRFAFVSCQDWQNGFYPAFRNLAREELDLVVHLGDYIYEYAADPLAPRQHDGPEVSSLESYRNRYALYKSDPHLQDAHAAFPWLAVPDDHEVENNYANATSEDGIDPAAFLARRANAFRAYYEHMPLRLRSFPVGPHIQLYRGLTVSDLVQFSALDTRQYRTDQPCGDGIQFRCAGALDVNQTMTGPEQERWLLGRLHRSSARWNVIAQQTMFAQVDFLAGPGEVFNMDQWDGYVAARKRITSFLDARRPSNPIVITGDIHSSWVHDIRADFADPASETVAVELVGTSISSDFPAALIPPVLAALPDNPHTQFFDGQYRGYVRCTVTPQSWRADFRAVPTILDEAADAFTLASFVIEDGQPGAMRM